MRDRRALLTAALGFLQLRQTPPELVPLRRWLDSWRGLGDIVRGLNAQGLDLELRQFPRGWRANLYPTGTAHSIVVASAWEPTLWRAVQQAGWLGLSRSDQKSGRDDETGEVRRLEWPAGLTTCLRISKTNWTS